MARSSEETGEKTHWQVLIPGLDLVWFFAAPFLNWKDSPIARKCVYAGILCGVLAVLLMSW